MKKKILKKLFKRGNDADTTTPGTLHYIYSVVNKHVLRNVDKMCFEMYLLY